MNRYIGLMSWQFSIPFLIFITTILTGSACKGNQEETNSDPEERDEYEISDDQSESETDKIILFFGNSLTAGYGLEENESFVYLIQERLDSLDLDYSVINAGLSGETTAGGHGRIDWVLNQQIDIFILELGGNDILRGIQVENTEDNLRAIVEKVRDKSREIKIIIAGMQAPPNMGQEYTRSFNGIYPKLSEDYDTGLIPFFLQGVASDPHLNLPDGIHPNAEGQKILVENVWKILEGYLKTDT